LEIVAFCNFKLCLLAMRHGDDSSQRCQLDVNKLKVKFEDFSPLYLTKTWQRKSSKLRNNSICSS